MDKSKKSTKDTEMNISENDTEEEFDEYDDREEAMTIAKEKTADEIRASQHLPKGAISEAFKPQMKKSSDPRNPNVSVLNPSDKKRSVRIPSGSNDTSDIRRRTISQTGLAVYISGSVNEDQVELTKKLINLAAYVKEAVLEKMPEAEIRSIITTPKRSQVKTNQPAYSYSTSPTYGFLTRPFVQLPEIRINMFRKEVFVNGKNKKLTSREFDLLSFLIESTGKPVSREKLLKLVWGTSEVDNNSRTVDVHIRRLRKKLGDDVIIQTIRRSGYQFDVRNNIVFVNEPGFD